MKKTFNYICTLAALLMAGAAFTACSSDDSIVEEQPVVNPSEPVYTLTINANEHRLIIVRTDTADWITPRGTSCQTYELI